MKNSILSVFLIAFILLGSTDLYAACLIRGSNGLVTGTKNDPLFKVLQNADVCPENVQNFKNILQKSGLSTQPYMVANRGIHNPSLGSFSFFEQVNGMSPILKSSLKSGEFFFGHFTAAENQVVISDQEPTQGKLLIELIAWDEVKSLFNFYELISTGKGAQWFYRGDSADILADNALLYLNPQGPKFGSTLRCSGCHISGGPIMKEMATPHNDWWTSTRPLVFTPNKLSSEIATWTQKIGDASELSQLVKAGIARLEQSPQYQTAKQKFSLQATLRPLFCETEINLESDLAPLNKIQTTVQIPSASLVSPFLARGSVQIASAAYQQILDFAGMQFPETHQKDADHGWLVPVKGESDLIAIQSLIKNGIITEEFAADVLAVDFENPLFSSKRCGLLKMIPPEGLEKFPDQLKSSILPEAKELYENLTNPIRNKQFHAQRAQDYLVKTQANLSNANGQTQMFKNLLEKRQAVFDAEISKNPRGQILEPGFRVIFPIPKE